MYYDNNIPEPFKRVFEFYNNNPPISDKKNNQDNSPELEISERPNTQKHNNILSIFAILCALDII